MTKTKTAQKTSRSKTTKAPTKKKASKAKRSEEVKVDRRVKAERRGSSDRRTKTVAVEDERRSQPERRKVSRRRQIDPTTCERDYNVEEIEFMQALDAYKRAAGRMFPTCSEILEVLRDLGYRRLTPAELARLAPPAAAQSEDDGNADAAAAEINAVGRNEASGQGPDEDSGEEPSDPIGS